MTDTQHLNSALLVLLTETFEEVQGIYLDRGTSIFESLAAITAEEASRPTSSSCASLAAHVEHMTYYIEIVLQFIRGEKPETDWEEIWLRVKTVSKDEWQQSQQNLKAAYHEVRQLVESTANWNNADEIAGAIGLIAHNAYHLGEIRQALCALKPDR